MNPRYTLLGLLVLLNLPCLAAPLEFIANQGQWKARFLYRSIAQDGDIYLERGGFTYMLGAGVNHALIEDYKHRRIKEKPILRFHAYKMFFEGCDTGAEVSGTKPQQHYYNFFLGNEPSRWKSGIHPNLAVDYKGLYPGIDAHVYSQNGRMKYEFIVAAGADIDHIRLRYEGTNGLKTSGGKLLIATSVGTVEELQPYAYQYVNGDKREVRCSYRIERNVVSYFFPNGYDSSQTLVIDPTVVFATYTGSTSDNWGFTATYDSKGNFYSGGIANSIGYPITTGAFQATFAGGSLVTNNEEIETDIVITKFNPGGTALIYSTYLGGSDNEQPHSLVVDTAGRLTVMGRTYSSNYPTTTGAYDQSYNGGADICITRFNAAGTALVGSTYVGGTDDDGVNETALTYIYGALKHNYGDDARGEVITDQPGNVYVAASSFSTNFPVTSAAQSTAGGGGQDAVLFKLNANLTSMVFSTYLGGSEIDAANSLTLDAGETHIYVTGGTVSSNFPTTSGALHASYQGGAADGFIARYDNGGSYALQKCTYIGRGNYDQCYGVQTDIHNTVYVNGQTLSGDFPVTSGVYANAYSSQFVMAVDSNLGSTVFSTVYGTGDSTATNISPVAFLVDSCKNIYISGWGGQLANSDSYIFGLPTTSNAAQSTTDGADFYFIVFTPGAQSLLYASYMGGTTAEEHVDGGTSRFDKHGVVYQAMCGGCGGYSDFPTTTGAWSSTNNSTNCNLIAFKQAFQFSNVDAGATAIPGTKGCVPFTVNFQNTSASATAYSWDFGDGTATTTQTSPTHTFTTGGIFRVRLVAFNPNACNLTDTVFLSIVVNDNIIKAGFDFTKLDSCSSPRVQFTNTSQYKANGPAQFVWDFGDGTTFNGFAPPVHNYASKGSYTVKLIVSDTSACNSPDSVTKTADIDGFRVNAAFTIKDTVCGLTVTMDNASIGAQSYNWDFGDGQTSTAATPSHRFNAAGTYTITLVASNPLSCNGVDTFTRIVIFKNKPVADYSFTPNPPVPNEAIQFTNQSTGATRYQWDLGYGGQRSTAVNPSYLYPATGKYNVCLTAFNDEGCADTMCRQVDAAIDRIVDVPNAFTPNGDGRNDILYVHGAAILQFSFKLFDRWGHMVFETSALNKGWDGIYNGQPAPTEGYAYLMDVTFIDGVTLTKKGNITLLR